MLKKCQNIKVKTMKPRQFSEWQKVLGTQGKNTKIVVEAISEAARPRPDVLVSLVR